MPTYHEKPESQSCTACFDTIIDSLKPTFLWKAGTAHQKVSKPQSLLCFGDFPPAPKTLNIHEAQGFQWAQAL